MEADEWKFIKEDAPEETNISDDELLKLVDKQLNDGHRKLFIVLHMYGSHFNYKERYPSDMAVFRPDSLTDAKYENREYLLNAYDNTICYTDGLLASLIEMLQRTNASSAMLYTSDMERIFLMMTGNCFCMRLRYLHTISCMFRS